jgi:hypothetical protein
MCPSDNRWWSNFFEKEMVAVEFYTCWSIGEGSSRGVVGEHRRGE